LAELTVAGPTSTPVDIISAMMSVWRIRGKIIRTVRFCILNREDAMDRGRWKKLIKTG